MRDVIVFSIITKSENTLINTFMCNVYVDKRWTHFQHKANS